MSEHEHGGTVRLSEVITRTAKRWRLILAITLLGAVLGAAYSFIEQDQYTASATLTVSPITTNPFNAGAVNQQINITTERAILNSPEVARIAANSLDRDVSPTELLAGSEVSAPSGSQVLEVTVTADSPSDAADFANALATAYLDFRAEGAADVALGFIDDLDRRILALEGAEAPDAANRAALSSLRDQRSSLSLVAENPGRIIGEATPPTSPSSPGLGVWAVIGTALGLLLGSTLAFLSDRLDPRVRSGSKLTEKSGVRVVDFRGDRDRDAARRVARLILQRTDAQHLPSGPLRLILLDMRDVSAQPLIEALSEELAAAEVSTRVVTASEHLLAPLVPAMGGRTSDQQSGLLLIQASNADQASWKECVLEDGVRLLIVTCRTTRMAEVTRALSDARAAMEGTPVLAFIDEPVGEAPRTHHRRWRSAHTTQGDRA